MLINVRNFHIAFICKPIINNSIIRAIINGNVYNRRIDSNTNNPLVAHDSDEYSTSLGTKTSFHASNRKPKTRGRSFPIPRVTPLSRARGYRINSSIQTRLRLTSRKHARNRGVARLKSAVELVIFCFGRGARMAITRCTRRCCNA